MKKPLLHKVAAAALFLGLVTAAQAQTGNPENDPFTPEGQAKTETDRVKMEKDAQSRELTQIRVQVEFIDVSHEQFTELMFGAKPPANDGELRQQVAQLIKDGKATITETLLSTSRSGQKATSESVEEFIYPTEYEPATLPDNNSTKSEDGTIKPQGSRPDFAVGPMPTAFSTRNLGSTLEIEPFLSENNKTIYGGFKLLANIEGRSRSVWLVV